MSAAVIPFPRRRPVIFIDPVPNDGGSWGVFLQRPGQPAHQAAVRFALESAITVARHLAKQHGADFLEDAPPHPQGAA